MYQKYGELNVHNVTCIVGLVDHFIHTFIEVSAVCLDHDGRTDIKHANAVLQTLLETFQRILKYVSDVVRKALQVSLFLKM